ncbi:hypothetical protein GCM10027586_12520 [Kineococcus gypseus]|uniref:helix-turn-helix domain-containing protein n=1 Tax=Kineococcus gypseus TaxID=1637102 RepID=UPI003D7CCF79
MPFASPVERHLAQALARTLRERRTEIGLTQEEVAEAVGISRNHYGLYESGLGNRPARAPLNPTLATLVAIADALHLSLPDLIDRVYELPPRERSA